MPESTSFVFLSLIWWFYKNKRIFLFLKNLFKKIKNVIWNWQQSDIYFLHTLTEFYFPHRVVNVSSSAGELIRIPGEELRKKFSSSTLTEEELCSLMSQFVKWVLKSIKLLPFWFLMCIFICMKFKFHQVLFIVFCIKLYNFEISLSF